jgi:predicted DNA binding CopG/RHH family protein
MRKKTTGAREKALRRYYDRSSALAEGRDAGAVRARFPKPRRLVALRLDEETLEGVRRLATEKGLNYSTLMRMWITERMKREIA